MSELQCQVCGKSASNISSLHELLSEDSQKAPRGCFVNTYCQDCADSVPGRSVDVLYEPESLDDLLSLLSRYQEDIVAILLWWTNRPQVKSIEQGYEYRATSRRRPPESDCDWPEGDDSEIAYTLYTSVGSELDARQSISINEKFPVEIIQKENSLFDSEPFWSRVNASVGLY